MLRCRCPLQSSPEIKAFMAQQGLTSVADLETYFEGRVLGLAKQAGRNYIVWQVIHLLAHAKVQSENAKSIHVQYLEGGSNVQESLKVSA